MKVTMVKALTSYFNIGEGKRSVHDWSNELKALSTEEKQELAEGVVSITGDDLQNPAQSAASIRNSF